MTERELLLAILNAYQAAEYRLLARIAAMVRAPVAGSWEASKLANLRHVLDVATTVLAQLEQTTDPMMQQLIMQAFLAGAGPVAGDNLFAYTSGSALNVLLNEAVRTIRQSRLHLLRSVDDAYRSIIVQVMTNATLGVTTRQQAAAEALRELAQRGLSGFVDRTGRRWELAAYVEMATRTVANQAYREGRIAGIVASGGDLGIIRGGPGHCPRCSPWRNRVVSISGGDRRYPALQDAIAAGVFHPNCRCTIAKYVPGLTVIEHEERVPNYYDAEQEQRALERAIRAVKRQLAVEPGNAAAQSELRALQAQLRELIAATPGLRRKPERETIGGAR